jgi:predicted phosphodiesterase
MRIGLLTDTHLPSTIRHLWDEVKTAFAGVDLILHGGDIVTPRVLDWLGFATTRTEGLKIEHEAWQAHVRRVTPEAIAERRATIQQRGRTQSS